MTLLIGSIFGVFFKSESSYFFIHHQINHPSPSSIAQIKLQLTLSAVRGLVNLDVVSREYRSAWSQATCRWRSRNMQQNLNVSAASSAAHFEGKRWHISNTSY